jgi:pantoate--beta-alanine ligase
MSSRNSYLDAGQRQAAAVLYRALSSAQAALANGEKDAGKLRQMVIDVVAAEPHAQLQYVSCADYENLSELETVNTRALLSLAVIIGKTRLIDNVILEAAPG